MLVPRLRVQTKIKLEFVAYSPPIVVAHGYHLLCLADDDARILVVSTCLACGVHTYLVLRFKLVVCNERNKQMMEMMNMTWLTADIDQCLSCLIPDPD